MNWLDFVVAACVALGVLGFIFFSWQFRARYLKRAADEAELNRRLNQSWERAHRMQQQDTTEPSRGS